MSGISSPRGTVEQAPDGARVVFRRDYPDAVEDVWAALTEPARLGRWIGTFTGTAAEGSTVQFVMTAEGAVDPEPVTILSCAPPRHLLVDIASKGQPVWRLEVTLEEAGSGTALTFVHHLADAGMSREVGPGWQFYLDRLGAALVDDPMPEWEPYPALADHYGPAPA